MEKALVITILIISLILIIWIGILSVFLIKKSKDNNIKNNNSNVELSLLQLNEQIKNFSNQLLTSKSKLDDINSYLDSKLKLWLEENKNEAIKKINDESQKSILNANQNFMNLRKEIDLKINAMTNNAEKQLKIIKEAIDTYFESELQKKLKIHFEEVDKNIKDLNKVLIESNNDQSNMKEQMTNLTEIMSGSKTRGNLGEIMLENILENNVIKNCLFTQTNMQSLAEKIKVDFPENMKEKKTNIVDSAILYKNRFIIIDSKFPIKDYDRYMQAKDPKEIEKEQKNLIASIKLMAKDISEKYICEPITIDYAYMYIPSISLYSTILTYDKYITKDIWDKYKVILVDPTNLLPTLRNIMNDIQRFELSKNTEKIQELLKDIFKSYSLTLSELEKSKSGVDKASELLESSVKRVKRINNKLGSSKLLNFDDEEKNNNISEN